MEEFRHPLFVRQQAKLSIAAKQNYLTKDTVHIRGEMYAKCFFVNTSHGVLFMKQENKSFF
jgi:hypothetical protein